MTAKILESFSSKLAEQWVANLLTPAFVFWLGGFITIIQRYGWQNLVTEFTRHPEPLQIAILVGGLCIITTSAFVVQRFDYATLRFLEGYGFLWLSPIRKWRIVHYQDRKNKLDKQCQKLERKEYERKAELKRLDSEIENYGADGLPTEKQDEYSKKINKLRPNPDEQEKLIQLRQSVSEITELMPTRLGNILRAAERKPLKKYGLDAVFYWSRLWMLLPDGVKKDLQETRTDLNIASRVWLWSILFCGWAFLGCSLWTSWSVPLGFLSACFAYQWAIDTARTYGELIEAAFDLYRHLLYQAIRWELPTDPKVERSVGLKLTEYLQRGSDP